MLSPRRLPASSKLKSSTGAVLGSMEAVEVATLEWVDWFKHRQHPARRGGSQRLRPAGAYADRRGELIPISLRENRRGSLQMQIRCACQRTVGSSYRRQ